MQKKYTNIPLEDLQAYHDGRCSARDLARKHNCTNMTVCSKARAVGLNVDKRTGIIRGCKRKLTPTQITQICEEMAKPDKCLRALEKRFGCHMNTLYYYAKVGGVRLPGRYPKTGESDVSR